MSYDNSANAVRRLEERFERLLLLLSDMQAAIGRVQQPSYNGAGGQPGGGGSGVYSIPATAIGAGSSGTAVVSALVGGALVTVNASGTIYNQMNSATVNTTGLTIMVGANPDGTFSVISQSC